MFDVDDLKSFITVNSEARIRETVFAEQIINEEAAAFCESLRILDKGETLGLLRQKMHDSARNEIERFRPRLGALTPEQEAIIEQLLLSTINKIAHPIFYALRRSHEAGATEFAEILCTMLGGNQIETENAVCANESPV